MHRPKTQLGSCTTSPLDLPPRSATATTISIPSWKHSARGSLLAEMAAATLLLRRLLPSLMLLPLFVAVAAEMPMPVNEEVLGLVVFKSALSDPSGALAAWTESSD